MDFFEVAEKYHDKFDDYFPTMCFQSASDDELIKMMNECINKNVKAEELYNLNYADNIQY